MERPSNVPKAIVLYAPGVAVEIDRDVAYAVGFLIHGGAVAPAEEADIKQQRTAVKIA